MRHRKGNRKLGRPTDQRLAMLRDIVRGLFKAGKINVTFPPAKKTKKPS